MYSYVWWAIAINWVLAFATPAGLPTARAVEAASSDLPADVQPMVRLINEQRAAAGLAPLVEHPVLASCADQYSETLAKQGGLSHTGPDGSNPGQRMQRCGYNWRHYGENLAAGQHDAAEAVAAWMSSPSHRRIMLSPRLHEIGVGYTYRENDPALYVEYYVLHLGTR